VTQHETMKHTAKMRVETLNSHVSLETRQNKMTYW